MEWDNGKKFSLQEIGLPRLCIIILCGIVLLILSLPDGFLDFGHKDNEKSSQESGASESLSEKKQESVALNAMDTYVALLENQTQEILSNVDGVGRVDVMITLAASEEQITLQDQSRQEENYENNTVLVEEENGNTPYVVQVNAPVIQGVVVVAQGAGSGEIDREIIQGIQALFPIEAHKIKVMKRKSK